MLRFWGVWNGGKLLHEKSLSLVSDSAAKWVKELSNTVPQALFYRFTPFTPCRMSGVLAKGPSSACGTDLFQGTGAG
jgi:hypothetical protein